MTNNHNKNKSGTGVGAGLIATGAAIAAGYYFYMSKDAKKHRKIVADWAVNLKDDILVQAETLKENLNQESLMGIIDQVAETYYTAKNVSKEDVLQAVEELKENWAEVLKELKKSGSKVAIEARSAAGKTAGSVKRVGSKARTKRKNSRT